MEITNGDESTEACRFFIKILQRKVAGVVKSQLVDTLRYAEPACRINQLKAWCINPVDRLR